jgi:hypothetical protein
MHACARPITRIIMFHDFKLALFFWALALPAAHAQQPAPKPSPAADAGARVPDMRYDSAFTGYQPYREQPPASWHDLNEEAHKAGGHIGIFGGAHGHQGAKPPATAPRQENKK